MNSYHRRNSARFRLVFHLPRHFDSRCQVVGLTTPDTVQQDMHAFAFLDSHALTNPQIMIY
jgi:hypothetical protein